MVTNRGFSTNRGDNRHGHVFRQRPSSKKLTSIVDLDNRQTIESFKNTANRSHLSLHQVQLQYHEQKFPKFSLELMTDQEKETVQGLVNIESAVIQEEMDYDIKEFKTDMATVTTNFNDNQRNIFTTIMTAVKKNTSCQILISARGGCRKIYLLNGILDAVKVSENNGCNGNNRNSSSYYISKENIIQKCRHNCTQHNIQP